MVKFSLRNKLIFFSVILALIPLGIAGRTLITITEAELKSSVNQELSIVANNLAEEIDKLYRDTWRAPLLLIRSAVDNENLGAAEKAALFLNGIKNVPDIVSLQITAERVSTPLLLVTQEKLMNKLQQAGVDPRTVLRVSAESISGLLDSKRVSKGDLTYIPETDAWLLTIVLPLERKIFNHSATLAARINLARLKKHIFLHHFTKSGTITLVDKAGRKIFDPQGANIGKHGIIQEALQFLSSGSRAIGVKHYTRPTGERMLGAFSFPHHFDWAVIVEENEADAYLAISKMVQSLITWVLVGCFVAVLGAIVFAQRISRPIVEIGKAAQNVGMGDFTVRVSEIKTNDEISDLGNRMNKMIEGLHERFQLQKFVSKQTIHAIKGANGKGVKLGGQRKKATVFFSDIRGFTAFSEKVEPEVVIEMLNTYLRVQAGIVREFQGDIDKYVGDQLVAVFLGEDMIQNAVLAAVEIHAQTAAINKTHPEWSIDIGIGIGINTGDVVMGAMGSEDRMDFTIVGDTVNIGARLCSNAKRGQILLSEASYREIEGIEWIQTTKLEPIRVKGKSQPIQIHEVVGVKSKSEERKYPRAEVSWPCTLKTPVRSIQAELRNISVGGVFISCKNPPDPGETVQMVIQAPNGRTLSVTVEVVWSNINGPGDPKAPLGIDARFVKISDADRQYLTDVISHLKGAAMEPHENQAFVL
jgi:adenylate cyclase